MSDEGGMEKDQLDEKSGDGGVQDEDDGPRRFLKKIKKTGLGCIKPGDGDVTEHVDLSNQRQDKHQEQSSQGTSVGGSEPVTVYPYIKGGRVVIVCNKFENDKAESRAGAEKDLENLTNVFEKKLGFRKVNKEDFDLTKSKMKEVLEHVVKEETNDCDCFVFAISSHGKEMVNPRKNGEFDPAVLFVTPSDQSSNSTSKVESGEYMMFLTDIIDMFSEKNCGNLKGKPKVFLFQCCRCREDAPDADAYDDGVETPFKLSGKSKGSHDASDTSGRNPQTDTSDTSRITCGGADAAAAADQSHDAKDAGYQVDTKTQPQDFASDGSLAYCFHDDCLVVAAVPPKKYAWRSSADGSWMIHYLNEAINGSGETIDFLHVFTETSRRMAERETKVYEKNKFGKTTSVLDTKKSGKKAVPVIEHTLTKDILIKIKS